MTDVRDNSDGVMQEDDDMAFLAAVLTLCSIAVVLVAVAIIISVLTTRNIQQQIRNITLTPQAPYHSHSANALMPVAQPRHPHPHFMHTGKEDNESEFEDDRSPSGRSTQSTQSTQSTGSVDAIEPQPVQVGKAIGMGNFAGTELLFLTSDSCNAEVYEGKYRNQPVALKKPKTLEQMEEFKKEVKVLRYTNSNVLS